LNYFGNWVNNVDELQKKFNGAEPFDNIIIPDFFNSDFAEALFQNFPTDVENDHWYKYNNPLEIKYAYDDVKNLPLVLKDAFYLLSTKEITYKINTLSGIDNLEYDPYLHGAGLHAHPTDGRLHMHLDYEKHPYLDKERRLNIIVYLSKDWQEEWNGETQLWDNEMKQCVVKSPVKFNTAFIFKTNNISWHGLPEPITCPEGVLRKSLAYYYISPIISNPSKDKVGNDGSGYRTKATYTKKPEDEYDEKLDRLYKIRPYRRIQASDLV